VLPRQALTYQADLGLPLVHKGKVRELYEWNSDQLLMVATDQISAFDFVLDSPIPDKGRILTALSLWWFDRLQNVVANHVVSRDVPVAVEGRAVVCERLDMVAIECVARGYLTGSGWTEYQRSGSVCGITLPDGLLDGSQLPEPIFTPTTKAELGEHDASITFEEVVDRVGSDTAEEIRSLTLTIYGAAAAIAAERGLLVADTKFEFGRRPDGTLVLADEALTPDSSRFWDAGTWRPGEPLPSYDKQFVRNWLLHESGWDRHSGEPPPPLPPEVVEATRTRYAQAYELLTGRQPG
jgi:phosphoribosylaminoimidazole-succinocarboxamide synthase